MEKILHTTPKIFAPIYLSVNGNDMSPAYTAPDNPELLESIERLLIGVGAHRVFTESIQLFLSDRDWRKLFALVRREAEYRRANYCGLLIKCKQYRSDLVIDVTRQRIHPYYKGCEVEGIVHRETNKQLQLRVLEQKIANLMNKRDRLRYDIQVQEGILNGVQE